MAALASSALLSPLLVPGLLALGRTRLLASCRDDGRIPSPTRDSTKVCLPVCLRTVATLVPRVRGSLGVPLVRCAICPRPTLSVYPHPRGAGVPSNFPCVRAKAACNNCLSRCSPPRSWPLWVRSVSALLPIQVFRHSPLRHREARPQLPDPRPRRLQEPARQRSSGARYKEWSFAFVSAGRA